MLRFNGEEPCEPPLSGDKTCRVFQWIGQSFENCDRCSKPYWEHLYEPVFGGGNGQFRVKVYIRDKFDGVAMWEWQWVNVITYEKRQSCRRKWEGANEYFARTRNSK